MLKKVVISPTNNHKAVAFLEDIKAKKEAAKKKIDERTVRVREMLLKQNSIG